MIPEHHSAQHAPHSRSLLKQHQWMAAFRRPTSLRHERRARRNQLRKWAIARRFSGQGLPIPICAAQTGSGFARLEQFGCFTEIFKIKGIQ
jgi:hypothetical protein